MYPINDAASSVKLQSRLFLPGLVGSMTTTGKNTARGSRNLVITLPVCAGPWLLPCASSLIPSSEALALPLLCPRVLATYSLIALSFFSLSRDSGNTKSTRTKLIREQAIATQNTDVTVFAARPSVPGLARMGIGCCISQAPTLGPRLKPIKKTPAKRENMCAREPLDVQSLRYADVADWSVDQPPRRPSMTGASRRSLCP